MSSWTGAAIRTSFRPAYPAFACARREGDNQGARGLGGSVSRGVPGLAPSARSAAAAARSPAHVLAHVLRTLVKRQRARAAFPSAWAHLAVPLKGLEHLPAPSAVPPVPREAPHVPARKEGESTTGVDNKS